MEKKPNFLKNRFISPDGKVWNTDTNRELKTSIASAAGYKTFNCKTKEGKHTRYYLHKAMAEIYIPNPKNLPKVGFKDNNKLNLNIDNLYWGTMKDVIGNARENIEWKTRKSRKVEQWSKDGKELIKVWNSSKEAAESLGINHRCIDHTVSKRYKTSANFRWIEHKES